ncbi:hypothetical protein AB0M46_23215 [Dactylosporangium sp. NPDC051485]|uniref:hypothetical protein n=1 Tax=Dactylosporangium sp. NPDC051485 TaxID=3154846 RepID=UPI00341B2347
MIVEAFAAEAPILGRIDHAFEQLSAQMTIPAGSLAPGWPHRETQPLDLRAELVARQGMDESIDPPWEGVVRRTRAGGREAKAWRLVALGLALHGLNHIEGRYRAQKMTERRDISADLVEGFLSGLPRLTLGRPHVEGRLLEAGRRQVKRGRSSRYREIPAEFGWRPSPDPGLHGWGFALEQIAAEVAAAGRPLDPIGLELITRTVLYGQPLPQAAQAVGLGMDAAYKRRERAEERIAAAYHITERRRASGRLKTRSRPAPGDATAGPA